MGTVHGELAVVGLALRVEEVLAAFIALLALVLVLTKLKRRHEQRIRKAASVGYFDADAARFGSACDTGEALRVAGARNPPRFGFTAGAHEGSHLPPPPFSVPSPDTPRARPVRSGKTDPLVAPPPVDPTRTDPRLPLRERRDPTQPEDRPDLSAG
ncbi:MAG: hypothetical protein ACYDES_10480 [Acidimicrobiales bacterium]